VLKSSRAISRVGVELKTEVSDISSVKGSFDIHPDDVGRKDI
jgi:hypothetical protein